MTAMERSAVWVFTAGAMLFGGVLGWWAAPGPSVPGVADCLAESRACKAAADEVRADVARAVADRGDCRAEYDRGWMDALVWPDDGSDVQASACMLCCADLADATPWLDCVPCCDVVGDDAVPRGAP